jgi:hypothetical protein
VIPISISGGFASGFWGGDFLGGGVVFVDFGFLGGTSL